MLRKEFFRFAAATLHPSETGLVAAEVLGKPFVSTKWLARQLVLAYTPHPLSSFLDSSALHSDEDSWLCNYSLSTLRAPSKIHAP